MSNSIVRYGYVWAEISDPCELRIIPSDGFHAALGILAGHDPSSVRLASVLTLDVGAKVAHDLETDRWYRRVRKSRTNPL